MKSLLLASLFALSTSVMAMPNVGDVAVLTGTVAGQPSTIKSELTGVNSDKSKYTQVTTSTIGSNTEAQTEEISADDLVTEDAVTMILGICSSIGGELETVTVPAGTYETCKITSEGSTVNIGMVPFGVVKVTSSDLSLELSSSSKAQ